MGLLRWHLEKEMAPTPALLPGESHGQRGLVGYSPWGRKESDTTEGLTLPQVALVVKNPSAGAGDIRDVDSIPGQEYPLEEGLATHSCSASITPDRKRLPSSHPAAPPAPL